MQALQAFRRPLAVLLASASILSATAAMATEITVWCWDVNFNGGTMREAAERYAEANPDVTVNIVDFAKVDLEQKLQAQLASGSTDGLPDIVLIEDYYAQRYLQSFPNAFEPLTDRVNYSDFAPYKVELATVNGQTYSLPFDSGVTGYFYRSDKFAEAGYAAADLEDITWDRLIEIGKDIKAKTGESILPVDPNSVDWVRVMMQSAGTWYFDAEGNPTIAGNPVIKKAIETYQDLLQADISKPVSGWAEYTGSFTSGDTISTFSGVWMTATIKANPDQSGQWAVAPIPRLDLPESRHASNIGGSSWYVLSSAPEKEEAINFLVDVWGNDVDFYQEILINQGAVGTLLKAREGEAYKASDEFFGGAPVWQNFASWLAEIPEVNYGIFTAEAEAAFTAQFPAIQNGDDVDQIISAIDSQVRQQIQ